MNSTCSFVIVTFCIEKPALQSQYPPLSLALILVRQPAMVFTVDTVSGRGAVATGLDEATSNSWFRFDVHCTSTKIVTSAPTTKASAMKAMRALSASLIIALGSPLHTPRLLPAFE